jgi:hypothetical protein
VPADGNQPTARQIALRAAVSILCSVGAWLSLLAASLGAPWFPFIPGFLLLGATAPLVAFVAFFVERTPLSGIACLCSMTAPVAFAIWWSHLPPDALS